MDVPLRGQRFVVRAMVFEKGEAGLIRDALCLSRIISISRCYRYLPIMRILSPRRTRVHFVRLKMQVGAEEDALAGADVAKRALQPTTSRPHLSSRRVSAVHFGLHSTWIP